MSAVEADVIDGEASTQTIKRSFAIERLSKDGKKVYRASLSSETPVEDMPGMRFILRHSSAAVNLSAIGESGLPLLTSHDKHDITNLIGRIKNVRIEAKRLVGDLVFSDANPNAVVIRGMIDEGTLTDTSIFAKVERIKRVSDGDNEVLEALRWTPIEASVVTIGGDHTVGFGRSSKGLNTADTAIKEHVMADDTAAVADTKAADKGKDVDARIEIGRQAADAASTLRMEDERIATIRKYGTANSISEDVVQTWIKRGASYEQIADDIIAIQKKRGEKGSYSVSGLDLTDKEKGQYSLSRAILAARDENWKDAGFELECHTTIADRLNKVPERGHFFVPQDIQRRRMDVDLHRLAQVHNLPHLLQRDLNTADSAAGGYLVQTSVAGFDELLRNISVAMRMGATTLPGLRDNVTIPRQSAAATAEWLGTEATGPTESQQTFVQLALTPKTVGATTEISRKLLMQSSIAVEGLVNADLAAVCGLAADLAVLSGTGASGQPLGIDNVTGVGTVTGTSLAFEDILEFQTDVAAGNVMPSRGGYVTTAAVASLCIQRVKYTSTASPLWEGNIWNGTMQGFPAMSSNQVATAVMYFGDWSKVVIAEWGTLEIDTNPYGSGFGAGIIAVRALYSVDVGVRLPVAFSRASSIT
jgi:HK97 family phage major capsid protein